MVVMWRIGNHSLHYSQSWFLKKVLHIFWHRKEGIGISPSDSASQVVSIASSQIVIPTPSRALHLTGEQQRPLQDPEANHICAELPEWLLLNAFQHPYWWTEEIENNTKMCPPTSLFCFFSWFCVFRKAEHSPTLVSVHSMKLLHLISSVSYELPPFPSTSLDPHFSGYCHLVIYMVLIIML